MRSQNLKRGEYEKAFKKIEAFYGRPNTAPNLVEGWATDIPFKRSEVECVAHANIPAYSIFTLGGVVNVDGVKRFNTAPMFERGIPWTLLTNGSEPYNEGNVYSVGFVVPGWPVTLRASSTAIGSPCGIKGLELDANGTYGSGLVSLTEPDTNGRIVAVLAATTQDMYGETIEEVPPAPSSRRVALTTVKILNPDDSDAEDPSTGETPWLLKAINLQQCGIPEAVKVVLLPVPGIGLVMENPGR